jgi:putative drug exporter of the RND superfamily
VAALTEEIGGLSGVSRDPLGPFPSADGEALQVVVPVDAGDAGWELIGEIVEEMRDLLQAAPPGLDHYVTGPGGYAADSAEAFSGIDGKLLAYEELTRRPLEPVTATAADDVVIRP